MRKTKISIAQLHYTTGALNDNCKKIINTYKQACANESSLVIFSDLAITGYPPNTAMLKPNFQKQCMEMLNKLAMETKNYKTFMLVGGIWVQNDCIYNSMFLLGNGQVFTSIGKHTIDYEGMCSEASIFTATLIPKTIIVDNIKIQVIIGSDIAMHHLAGLMSKTGVEIIIVTSTKPYVKESNIDLSNTLTKINKETLLPIIYLNQVGGNKNITAKGGSLIMSAQGQIIHRMPEWQECVSHTDWTEDINGWVCTNGLQSKPYNEIENIYHAMIRSLDDFIVYNKFNSIIVNLNDTIGTIISIIAAANLPSKVQITAYSFIKTKYTALMKKLKIKHKKINITKALNANKKALKELDPEVTDDKNITAKTIALIMDSLASTNNSLLLSTTDKTSIALGEEIYENVFAHYNIVGDLYKIELINMLKWLNKSNNYIADSKKTRKAGSTKLDPCSKFDTSIKNFDNALQEILDNGMSYTDLVKIGYSPKLEQSIKNIISKQQQNKNNIIQPLCISSNSFNTSWQTPPNTPNPDT
ncbi:Glutamine-dependent NAD(+) synthetase [Candidatus Xenohaliotis californiensis]|uniref:Glutamine-dependent NAD(+) synthetase n=1 Tax=Candidatus Xenohaliotis californiensis TaxID=84677 RepID=A0ABP0ETC9_9RICK|nr:Glutamine-dependent NAD(+) synthetase [Candidatus Xenohaliotis californiensis]